LDRDIGVSIQTAETVPPTLRVVEPKLMLPRVQPRMLRRARLLQLLDGDEGPALTLVNAPVGYGKTTFLRLWCIERREAVV
jgi:ATP/maltotriose-dependent transcriptional regulator MalT